jgi:hypothetical protein
MREAVEHRNSGEAIALKTLVRLAVRARNISRRHADAKQFFLREGSACEHGGSEKTC